MMYRGIKKFIGDINIKLFEFNTYRNFDTSGARENIFFTPLISIAPALPLCVIWQSCSSDGTSGSNLVDHFVIGSFALHGTSKGRYEFAGLSVLHSGNSSSDRDIFVHVKSSVRVPSRGPKNPGVIRIRTFHCDLIGSAVPVIYFHRHLVFAYRSPSSFRVLTHTTFSTIALRNHM